MKNTIFKENGLDLDQEADNLFSYIFSDYQKMYPKKELAYLEKKTTIFYGNITDKIKNASIQNDDQNKDKDKNVNKPKLTAMSKFLEESHLEEIFVDFTKIVRRCQRISLDQQMILNLYEISVMYIKSFKTKFLSKIVDFLESEL